MLNPKQPATNQGHYECFRPMPKTDDDITHFHTVQR